MIWLSQSERDALIYITSDLQAANTTFAVPRTARKVPDNALAATVDGESLVIVSIQGCIVGAAAAGFTLTNSFNGADTIIWKESTQGAGVVVFEHQMYRPLSGPIYSGGAAVSGATLKLALLGTPGTSSWLQIALALNHDKSRRGKRTALGGAYDGNSTS
jgi:hypothetical protein